MTIPRVLLLSLFWLLPSMLSASSPVNVAVEQAGEKIFVVEGAFEVNARPETVWEVLTDYEGIGEFVSSIRQSTIRQREPGRVVLEQQGFSRAWIVTVEMHVVLDVREHDGRSIVFRDLCGKTFAVYEGRWEIAEADGVTHVTYHLKADPNGRQPAMLARSALRGNVRRLLDEVRTEILARSAP